jgi:hypothetical protein
VEQGAVNDTAQNDTLKNITAISEIVGAIGILADKEDMELVAADKSGIEHASGVIKGNKEMVAP